MKIHLNNAKLKEFNDQFLKVLDNHAPSNKNIRANNSNQIKKTLTCRPSFADNRKTQITS